MIGAGVDTSRSRCRFSEQIAGEFLVKGLQALLGNGPGRRLV